ncbi:SPFH/Band 7/PHB domain protein [Paracoccus aestuarii]|uniref:SPFH/Band 7/PHB domain protein n=1 Tax=Paracoccus aestuarii TaxID=453842 RepID=A0A418ZVI0_9RHOB|nr:SPFH domain-containing protein [Paracoccus aestuarii]RJL02844.1 SPFH/Band 7/PHB domain protein [Paracoccus aestuarii]WCR01172.1 SPFH/Band 7/PHB domain protein [Paracoccus aestuarii]
MELVLALVAVLVLVVLLGLKIVPQSQNFVITRLGAYHRTLDAGVNVIVPFLDRVHSRVPVNDQVLSDIELEVVSADNVVFGAQLLVVYRIENPEAAVFRVNSINALVIGLVQSLVRSELGKVELDAVQSDRGSLNVALLEALEDAGKTYGIRISRSEITDVRLNATTQTAMAEVLAAERERRAAITRAEGQRRAAELNADAELYEAQRRADGIRAIAEANAEANRMISASLVGENTREALTFQTARMQVEALEGLAKSPNAKLIMLPGGPSNAFREAAAILKEI